MPRKRRDKISKGEIIESILDLWVKLNFIKNSEKTNFFTKLVFNKKSVLNIILVQSYQLNILKPKVNIQEEIFERQVKDIINNKEKLI